MSSDWNYITGPTPVDTGSALAQKWCNVTPADYVRLCNYQFVLPAFNVGIVSQQPGAYVIWQLNYSFPRSFSILNFLDIIRLLPTTSDEFTEFSLCIKYRVGDHITRYKFNDISNQRLYAPIYSGQIIKSNFSLEIYPMVGIIGGDTAAVNNIPITLISSIKFEPQPFALVGNNTVVPVSQAFGFLNGMNNELFVPLPISNPQPMNALGPFLSN